MRDKYLRLLDELEDIGKQHPELYDTDVRQSMWNSLMDGFARKKAGYIPPSEYSMYTPEGDRLVAEAIIRFLNSARQADLDPGLDTFHKRLDFLQDDSIVTDERYYPDDFFGGYLDPKEYDAQGVRLGSKSPPSNSKTHEESI
jgi:hypothetical protein